MFRNLYVIQKILIYQIAIYFLNQLTLPQGSNLFLFTYKADGNSKEPILPMVTEVLPMLTNVYLMLAEEFSVANSLKVAKIDEKWKKMGWQHCFCR
jgi:hypothetical protein